MTTQPKPKRLVLEVSPTRQISVRDFKLFMESMEKCGVTDETSVQVAIEREGSLKFFVPVPPREQPRKSRYKQEVEAQIVGRREAIARGEEVPGYVPPVKRRKVVKVPRQRKEIQPKKKIAIKARKDRGSDE